MGNNSNDVLAMLETMYLAFTRAISGFIDFLVKAFS